MRSRRPPKLAYVGEHAWIGQEPFSPYEPRMPKAPVHLFLFGPPAFFGSKNGQPKLFSSPGRIDTHTNLEDAATGAVIHPAPTRRPFSRKCLFHVGSRHTWNKTTATPGGQAGDYPCATESDRGGTILVRKKRRSTEPWPVPQWHSMATNVTHWQTWADERMRLSRPPGSHGSTP